jgi:sugar O-acyltransferase (sialic acid O-acetyltransferase NeuD family)
MLKDVVIFGVKDFAELAHYYLTHDSGYNVVAFTVHKAYMPQESLFCGLPIVPFEELESHYPPSQFAFFAPMAPTKMNQLREQVYMEGKQRGYSFISYISSRCTNFATSIGENCFVLEDNTIQPFVRIGDNVVLWSGNHIGHHSTIGNHVMFTSHVVLSGHCQVGDYSLFGVNATIRDGLTIGQGTFVAMGTSVIKSTPEWSFIKGSFGEVSGVDSRKMI